MASLHFARGFVQQSLRRAKLRATTVERQLHTCNKLLKKSKESLVIRKRGEFLYGVAPCLAALQANRRRVHAIYLKPGTAKKQGSVKTESQKVVWELAKQKKVDIHQVDKTVLERLSGKRPHQGIVIDADSLNFKRMDSEECKIESRKREENPLWLALDEIHDPMNLGAIIRCAYFLGVDRIITTAKKCCPLTPTVSKASSGAMEMMPVYAVNGMEKFLAEAGESGWAVLGTVGIERTSEKGQKVVRGNRQEVTKDNGQEVERENGQEVGKRSRKAVIDCNEYSIEGPTIVVLGNEGYGLHSSVEKACTSLLTISPLRELPQGFDSLNVAVATGIILHTLQNKKQTNS